MNGVRKKHGLKRDMLTEAGYTGAQQWCSFSWVHVLRDSNDGFRAKGHVLSVPTIAEDSCVSSSERPASRVQGAEEPDR